MIMSIGHEWKVVGREQDSRETEREGGERQSVAADE
jgi:hypothetical protein